MTAQYKHAPEVQLIGRELIREHHRHLTNIDVKFVFIDNIPKRNGKAVWGTARKISSLAAFLAGQDQNDENGAFFVITISEPIWYTLSPERRRALVDHELCHCWVDLESEEPRLVLVGHDLEEFVSVIQRHGLWRDEVTKFVEVGGPLLQNSLFEEGTEIPESSGDRSINERPLARLA